jgi:hypothetical protein
MMKKLLCLTAVAFCAASFASSYAVAQQAPAASGDNAPAPQLISEKEAAARLAAQGWLLLLDRKDWGRAWETTSSIFRSKVPLGTWMDAIPKAREPFGAFVERTPVETAYKPALQGQPPGDYVTVVFQSKFANREIAEVVTTVLDTDGRWRVTGYSAQ